MGGAMIVERFTGRDSHWSLYFHRGPNATLVRSLWRAFNRPGYLALASPPQNYVLIHHPALYAWGFRLPFVCLVDWLNTQSWASPELVRRPGDGSWTFRDVPYYGGLVTS